MLHAGGHGLDLADPRAFLRLVATSISRARLPANYEAAKTALATCERLDKVKD